MSKEIQIKIPISLYKAVEDVVSQTEDMTNPSEIVSYVLKQFVPDHKSKVYSKAEEKEIEKRLKDLGYCE